MSRSDSCTKGRWACVVAAVLVGMAGARSADAQFSGRAAKAHAKVKLLSSVEAIAPGKAFDVALHFRLDRGWHIYWQNGGDSGFPPNVKWHLPEGFTAGELRFPAPKRHINAAGIVSNIHEGDPALLVSIQPPAVDSRKKVTLAAKIKYLICEKICIRGEADVKLELPVSDDGSAPEPVNVELFARARKARPIKESKYAAITARLSTEKLLPGATPDLLVTVKVAEGYHLVSHDFEGSGLEKCDLFVETAPDIYFESAVYPKATGYLSGKLNNVGAYSNRFVIRVPGEVEAEKPLAAPPEFGGVLRFQACDDRGECFPPEALVFSLSTGKEPGTPAAGSIGSSGGESSAVAPTSGGSAEPSPDGEDALQGFLARLGIPGLLLGCFLYGLFINATPCVLPLLSIKVLGFVQQAHESRGRTLVLGLTFGAGVMVFFVILGFLAAAGKNVLQYPVAVIALGAVVMALALSMLGVYTLQVPTAATKLEATIQREGLASSFGKGALAPVLGFACTGPLLAGAFGWATQQPPHIAVLAFLFAGLGMASPYMLLGANPNWLGFLPRPGNWMITFERIMGFLLLGMVVWLLHPLIAHVGAEGLEWTLVFLVAIAMACWMLGKIDATMSVATRWYYRGGAGALVAVVGLVVYGWIFPLGEAGRLVLNQSMGAYSLKRDWSEGIPWRVWSPDEVASGVRSGNIVFVDFTAAYCTVCKANKALATDTPEVREKMKTLGVIPFMGDFTHGDPRIAAELRKHQRAGPPLNLIYPAGEPDSPIVLRPNLTKQYLLEKLDQAASRHGGSVASVGS